MSRIGESLDWSIVFKLLTFRYENTPTYLRYGLDEPAADEPRSVSDAELRELILFARSHWRRDPTNPRQLDAYQTMWLVPLDIGTALFAEGTAA